MPTDRKRENFMENFTFNKNAIKNAEVVLDLDTCQVGIPIPDDKLENVLKLVNTKLDKGNIEK